MRSTCAPAVSMEYVTETNPYCDQRQCGTSLGRLQPLEVHSESLRTRLLMLLYENRYCCRQNCAEPLLPAWRCLESSAPRHELLGLRLACGIHSVLAWRAARQQVDTGQGQGDKWIWRMAARASKGVNGLAGCASISTAARKEQSIDAEQRHRNINRLKCSRWRRREATKKAISRACSALSRGSQCVW